MSGPSIYVVPNALFCLTKIIRYLHGAIPGELEYVLDQVLGSHLSAIIFSSWEGCDRYTAPEASPEDDMPRGLEQYSHIIAGKHTLNLNLVSNLIVTWVR